MIEEEEGGIFCACLFYIIKNFNVKREVQIIIKQIFVYPPSMWHMPHPPEL